MDNSFLKQCPRSQSTNGEHNKVYEDNESHYWRCAWCGATGYDGPDFTKHWSAQVPETILMSPYLWKDIVSNDNEEKLRQIIREEVKAALEEWDLLKEIRHVMKHLKK